MHKQYGKMKYTLLLLMEKIATGSVCQIQSACQKVEESGRGSREQFHVSSVFLLCIYLASENAGNVFSFRLGPFLKPQKYTGQLLVIVWLLTVLSVFKLVRNRLFPLEIYKKHQQMFVSIFWNLSWEQKRKKSVFLIVSYWTQCTKAGASSLCWPPADPK